MITQKEREKALLKVKLLACGLQVTVSTKRETYMYIVASGRGQSHTLEEQTVFALMPLDDRIAHLTSSPIVCLKYLITHAQRSIEQHVKTTKGKRKILTLELPERINRYILNFIVQVLASTAISQDEEDSTLIPAWHMCLNTHLCTTTHLSLIGTHGSIFWRRFSQSLSGSMRASLFQLKRLWELLQRKITSFNQGLVKARSQTPDWPWELQSGFLRT